MDELKEIFSRLITPIMIAFASVVVRILFDDNAPSLYRIVRMVIIGLFVGGIVGAIVDPMAMPSGYKGGIVGVSALIAEDVIAVVVQAGGHIRKDPSSILRTLINIRWRK